MVIFVLKNEGISLTVGDWTYLRWKKIKGENYHEYYNAHHHRRRVGPIVWRRRRLLLEETTVGAASRIILTQIIHDGLNGRIKRGTHEKF